MPARRRPGGSPGLTLVTGLLGRRRIVAALREPADPWREEHTKGDDRRPLRRRRSGRTRRDRRSRRTGPSDGRRELAAATRIDQPLPRRRLGRIADDPIVARSAGRSRSRARGSPRGPSAARAALAASTEPARAAEPEDDARPKPRGGALRGHGPAARAGPGPPGVARSSRRPARSRAAASWATGLSRVEGTPLGGDIAGSGRDRAPDGRLEPSGLGPPRRPPARPGRARTISAAADGVGARRSAAKSARVTSVS